MCDTFTGPIGLVILQSLSLRHARLTIKDLEAVAKLSPVMSLCLDDDAVWYRAEEETQEFAIFPSRSLASLPGYTCSRPFSCASNTKTTAYSFKCKNPHIQEIAHPLQSWMHSSNHEADVYSFLCLDSSEAPFLGVAGLQELQIRHCSEDVQSWLAMHVKHIERVTRLAIGTNFR